VLRAGPFSDERVVNLANRRFVAYYFDVANTGAAGDPAAREFVVKSRPELGGSAIPTPPVLFMTPEGKVLSEVPNFASKEQVLKVMRTVLDNNPGFDAPKAGESRLRKAYDKALLRFELADNAGAKALLKGNLDDKSLYLLGHIHRLEKNWPEMDATFVKLESSSFKADLVVETAYKHWYAKDYKTLKARLERVPRTSNRYSEARYITGLADYLLGNKQAALKCWKETVVECAQDPWIYRADWAYTNVVDGTEGVMMMSGPGKRTSLLNRIGYLGPPNPDLDGPD
jgi:hypothetical protein